MICNSVWTIKIIVLILWSSKWACPIVVMPITKSVTWCKSHAPFFKSHDNQLVSWGRKMTTKLYENNHVFKSLLAFLQCVRCSLGTLEKKYAILTNLSFQVGREASSQPMLMLIMDVTFTPKNPPHAYTSNYEMHPAIGAVKLKALWQHQLLKLNIKFFLKAPQAVFGSEDYLLIF